MAGRYTPQELITGCVEASGEQRGPPRNADLVVQVGLTASFTEKVSRKRAKYENPLREVTDLVGIRIITYYLEDVAAVGEILKNEFQIDATNSVDKAAGLDPDRFGYTSIHYVVALSPDRRKLREWRPYASYRAEIQVRAALRHAWSAVNHKLHYKSPTEVASSTSRWTKRLSPYICTTAAGGTSSRGW